MGQYSELIGSFKRMGNFPLEADYIFNSEEELKVFYSQPENYVLLHRGLLRIVADPESNQQYLYWVNRKQTNNDLEFVKLLSFDGIDDLSSKLEDLKNKLNQEIEDRKHADNTIWGVEDKTQIPDDLNSIFDLANSIINLEEAIEDGFEGIQEILNSIQGDIKAIVGTESDNIKQYLESELNYKSLTEVSNTLNKFLNTYNENDSRIDTYPELLRFLDGYSDKDKLASVLDNLSSNILGSPVPTEEFRTLRAIEDFVRTFKSSLESRADNIQGELDNTQIGIGLNSDGSYSPDKETFYLKNATSIMNALKTLDSLINEAINNCNLEGVKTETADTRIYKLRDKTEVETNVLVSRESGNTIQIKGDGLYSGIRTTYDNGVLTIYANDNIIGQHVLGLSYIGIDSAYYDPSTESLVFKFIKEDKTTDEFRLPVHLLIREWTPDNSGASDTIVLTRTEGYTGEADKLSADARLLVDKYNILTKVGNCLNVRGTADNIVHNDVKVSVIIDNLYNTIKELQDRVTALENGGGGGGGGSDLSTISILSFTIDKDIYNESGSTINPTLSWQYSSDNISSQTINGSLLDTSLRSYTFNNITSDTTFTLVAKSLNTVQKSISVYFVPRLYLGTSPNETLTANEIKALTSDKLLYTEDYLGKKTFNCSGGKYVYYVVPTSEAAGVVVKDGNGFLFNAYTTYTIDITNNYGKTINYTVFRMNNKYYSEEIIFDFSIKS